MSTLLILEDEDGFLTLLAAGLSRAGHRVVAARSGPEGLQRAAEQTFDLVLVDQRLPGLTGLEFLERFRALGGQTPVIVMSGHADVPAVVGAMRLRAVDFLVKPFSLDTLLPLVERCARSATA